MSDNGSGSAAAEGRPDDSGGERQWGFTVALPMGVSAGIVLGAASDRLPLGIAPGPASGLGLPATLGRSGTGKEAAR
ncbi:hypothetical protein [Streptomyces sp. CC228A]|uniref:hypothetical protein n=1 Tax=Streptomyces sp. CC228A TaxID=2898186 RepID=UPI001F1F7F92|nr:hypothetical protein [Streptomyces sp. CC228A]